MMAKHICRKGYIWHIYLFINRIFSLLHHEQYVKELAIVKTDAGDGIEKKVIQLFPKTKI